MDAKLIHPAINVILLEMQKRLDNAASIAAAAVACSQANQIEKSCCRGRVRRRADNLRSRSGCG
jgi:hypothetical protein